jgi:hypothetical protein
VAGLTEGDVSHGGDFTRRRFNADGSLDRTSGNNGLDLTNLGAAGAQSADRTSFDPAPATVYIRLSV